MVEHCSAAKSTMDLLLFLLLLLGGRKEGREGGREAREGVKAYMLVLTPYFDFRI